MLQSHSLHSEPLAPRFVFVIADASHRLQLLGKLKELAEMTVEMPSPLASENSSPLVLRERSGTTSLIAKSSVSSQSGSEIGRELGTGAKYISSGVWPWNAACGTT